MLFSTLTRYISIFHQAWLSKYDDSRVAKTTRLLVTALSLIIPWNVDIFKGVFFIFLTNQNPEYAQTGHPKDIRRFILFEILFIIFVQVKIEFFDREHTVQVQVNNQSASENQGYSKTTIRFIIVLSTICLLTLTFWFFIGRKNAENIVLSRLKVQLVIQLVAVIIMPIILISRNPNMTQFFKEQFKSFFGYCRKTFIAFIIIFIDLLF